VGGEDFGYGRGPLQHWHLKVTGLPVQISPRGVWHVPRRVPTTQEVPMVAPTQGLRLHVPQGPPVFRTGAGFRPATSGAEVDVLRLQRKDAEEELASTAGAACEAFGSAVAAPARESPISIRGAKIKKSLGFIRSPFQANEVS
jgi:hypothetical protein